jgi:4-amino-4-deoxy-L-arabinose transferase-like glycosyltransferase
MMNHSVIMLPSHKKSLIYAVILLMLVLVGFCIRSVELGKASLSYTEPLHMYAAKSILETAKSTLPSGKDYSRSQLFTNLVALSFKRFGLNEFAARFPSVIFGTLSIVLIFFIGKSFFGAVSGLIAAFMVALIPFEVVWSRECRMYTMFQFFFLFGFFAFYKGFEEGKARIIDVYQRSTYKHFWSNIGFLFSYWKLDLHWLLFSAVLLFISFKVHALTGIYYFSLLFYLSSMLFFYLVVYGFKIAIRSKYFFFLFLLILASGLGLILFPKIFHSITDFFKFDPLWYEDYGGPLFYFYFLVTPWLFPIAALFIIGTIQICTRTHKAGLYTLICIVVPLILHSFASVKQPRYIFNIFPLILLVSSYSLYNLFKEELRVAYFNLQSNYKEIKLLSSKKLSYIALSCLFSIWLFFVFIWLQMSLKAIYYPMYANLLGGMHHAEWRGACQYVKKFYKTGDVIISTIPLAALYYCGKIDYALDIAHYVGSPDYPPDENATNLKKDGFYIEAYSGAKAIINLDTFKKALSENSRGWLVLDKQRFVANTIVPSEIRRFILMNLVSHTIRADGTMLVFSWDKGQLGLE